jgi:antitoxin Phd
VPDYVSKLRAQLGSVTTVAASDAKNQFGQVLDSALSGSAVVITKHDVPKAILISIEEFEAMTTPRHKLDALTAEFDAMYMRMQQPPARRAVDKLLATTPAKLGGRKKR